MGEETPALVLSAQELWQWSQTVVAVTSVLARLRVRLVEQRAAGRLAFSDAEHAARLVESWRWPPVRLMTEAEQAQWRARIPAALTGSTGEGPVVGVAQLDGPDDGSGEWCVEAHLRDGDGSVESVFLVCRDASDAVAVAAGLRRNGTAEQARRLRNLALGLEDPQQHSPAGAVLPEGEWVAAVRQKLSPQLADRLIPTGNDPSHLRAWQELVRLAQGEVARVGADPRKLAGLIGSVPRWDDDVRNPAALAHWALTQARAEPGYTAAVTRDHRPGIEPIVENADRPAGHEPQSGSMLRPGDPAHAIAWAGALDGGNVEHRLAAKVEFGRWGAAVDRALAARFPGLVTSASTAADRPDVHADRLEAAGRAGTSTATPEPRRTDAAAVATERTWPIQPARQPSPTFVERPRPRHR